MATTHYPQIKNYALVTEGFENASSDFDLENLKPTYKLLIGLPGKSNAFAISKKLGLDDSIIKRANSFMDSNDIQIEELLKNIYNNKLAVENEKISIEKRLNEISALKMSLEEKKEKLNQKENSIIENAKAEARNILMDAKKEASSAISQINKISENINNDSIKNLNNLRNELNASIKNNTSSTNITNKKTGSLSKEAVYIGMNVRVINLNQFGIVTSLVNKSNQLQVQIGSAKIMVSLSNIEEVNVAKSNKKSTSSYKTNKSKNISTEINVIGYNVEEAIFVVDKYLDDCALANLNSVRIVHGKGTGTLRNGIHTFLKSNSHVKSFRLGTFGEGETGVTVVELK